MQNMPNLLLTPKTRPKPKLNLLHLNKKPNLKIVVIDPNLTNPKKTENKDRNRSRNRNCRR